MKTNRILLYLTTLFLWVNIENSQAQSSTATLDKVVEKFRQSGGISASFSLTVANALDEPIEKQNGTIKLSGNKFYWETPAMTVWYDGKLQWAYVKATDEVNLTEPTPEEIAAINPYILIDTYKQNFNAKALKSANNQERVTELTPKKKGTNIERIVITTYTATSIPYSFKIDYSDRTHCTIVLSKYATGQNFTDATFVFDKKQYPQAELIDLR